jgi:hypothetical protein
MIRLGTRLWHGFGSRENSFMFHDDETKGSDRMSGIAALR